MRIRSSLYLVAHICPRKCRFTFDHYSVGRSSIYIFFDLFPFLIIVYFAVPQCIVVVSSFQRQCICWFLFPRNLRHWRSDLFGFVLQRSQVSFREPAPRAASGNDSCYSRHATVCTNAFAADRTGFPPIRRAEHVSRMRNTSSSST